MKGWTNRERERTARHEAAHAVIAWLVRMDDIDAPPWTRITVRPAKWSDDTQHADHVLGMARTEGWVWHDLQFSPVAAARWEGLAPESAARRRAADLGCVRDEIALLSAGSLTNNNNSADRCYLTLYWKPNHTERSDEGKILKLQAWAGLSNEDVGRVLEDIARTLRSEPVAQAVRAIAVRLLAAPPEGLTFAEAEDLLRPLDEVRPIWRVAEPWPPDLR